VVPGSPGQGGPVPFPVSFLDQKAGSVATPEQTKVLVVDDGALDRKLLYHHLTRAAYQVELAEDGQVAWELLEKDPSRFQVLLLDRAMPRMNGLQLMARMKEHPRLRMVPVILQTALARREEMLEGIRAGAYYYLTKPFDVEMLLSVIGTAANDYEHYRELQQKTHLGLTTLALLHEAVFTFQRIEDAHSLGTFLADACPDPESAVIGLTELLVNAVEHGNLGITYDEKTKLNAAGTWADEVERRLAFPENARKRVEVRFLREDHCLTFTIRDQGSGFDWKSFLDVEPTRAFDTHGRGIAMANRVSFARLQYGGCGNEVTGAVELPDEERAS
jgi:CheY-like chemotaxis protein/anti-sigma regulatory factor (Ser/Thr protein kinase)